jgi:hypothetical protein
MMTKRKAGIYTFKAVGICIVPSLTAADRLEHLSAPLVTLLGVSVSIGVRVISAQFSLRSISTDNRHSYNDCTLCTVVSSCLRLL